MKMIYLFIAAATIFIFYSCESSEKEKPGTETGTQISHEKPANTSENDTENDIVTLCPYCLSKITEETILCKHCEQDTRNDAPFEMSQEEFQSLEKKSCSFCSQSIPELATICLHCKKELE